MFFFYSDLLGISDRDVIRKDILGDKGEYIIINEHIRFTTMDLRDYCHHLMELTRIVIEVDN